MPRPAFRSVAMMNARNLQGLAAGLVLCTTGLAMGQQAAAPSTPLDLSGLTIRRNGYQGAVNFVTSKDGAAIKVDVPKGRSRLASLAFLDTYGQLFGITDAAAHLALRTVEPDPFGWSHTTYQQVFKGIKVFTGTIKVHQNVAGGVVSANGHFRPIKPSLGVVPTIDAPGAEAIGLKTITEAPRAIVEHSELMIVDPGWYGDAPTGERLAYYVVVTDVEISVRAAMFIDAHTGEIIDRWSLIEQLLSREIHDANGTNSLPGPLARSEGQAAVGIADVDAAYEYAGDFYRYLQRAFGRDSIDNAGLTIVITPNSTAAQCPNAFWNGFQAAFCTGVVTDDVVAHELAHGLTGYTAGLIYQNQAGQLNESFSDVFGELVDMFNGNVSAIGAPSGTLWPLPPAVGPGIDTPNNARSVCSPRPGHPDGVRWLVGEDSAAFGGAIRDMFDPTCRNHPDRANSAFQTCNANDSGGVHSGSGVPNHAFMLTTDGGTFNGRTISGIGLIKSGAVWYRALTVYLTPASDFKDAYDALTSAATDLIGTSPNDPRTGTPGETFTAFDALQVTEALLATEMNTDGLCGQTSNVLDEALPPECASASVIFSDNFEAPTLAWTVTNSAPPTPYNWVRAASLPFGRTGHAAYCEDRAVGDCNAIDESATHTMTSPSFAVPAGSMRPFLAFTHQLGSEGQFDGGTLELSINGGAFIPVPRTAIEFNPFNGQLASSAVGNTNPLAGRDAWTGTGGKWGRTIVDLSSFGLAGTNVQVRLVFGKDGCSGSSGWYVDDLVVYNCPDCDTDGTTDLRQYRYRASSPTLITIGNGENRTFTLAATPVASGNITLELTAKGDFSLTTEYLEVALNGIVAGRIFEVAGIDCSSGSITALRGSLSVPAATWNSARALGAAGNTVDILLTGSVDVNAGICNGTYAGASVRYHVAGPTDTNSNLVPDSCEVQCVSINVQPAPAVNACLGGSLNLLISAAGSTPITYQWTRNNINIAGATAPTLTITPVIAGTAGTYRCVVTNSCGPITSNPATVTTDTTPTVSATPTTTTSCAGSPLTLSASAVGGSPAYQWRKGGIPIGGATSQMLNFASLVVGDAGSYDVIVTNACGTSPASNAVTVTVRPPITGFSTQPASQAICRGASLTLTAIANPTAAQATYQWRKNTVNISGATATTLLVTNSATASTAGTYDCVATNICGNNTSSAATITYCAADFNCSGSISVQDIFDFLAAYFANDNAADFNGSSTISVQDIFDYLSAYFAGC